jgi:hypothetical protein
MQAEVIELGDRPKMLTPARSKAPQAAVALAKIFEQPGHNWADKADIILDWNNQLLGSDEPKLQYPVMLIKTNKYVPGKGHLVTQTRWDIDNVFEGEVVSQEVLFDVVEELKMMTLKKLEEANVI